MIRDERTATQHAIDAYKARMKKCIEDGTPMPVSDYDPFNPPPRPGTRVVGMGKSCFDKD